MIAITPEGMFTAQQFKVLRDTARRNALGAVRGQTAQNLVTRPLLPTDLYGAVKSVFSNSSAMAAADTAYPQAGLAKVPQTTGYAVFGYAAEVSAPLITEMWLGNGAQTFAKIRLSPIYAQGSARPRAGYFDPVYFVSNDTIVITLLCSAAILVNAEVFELIGIVAETPTNVVTQAAVAGGQSATTVDG